MCGAGTILAEALDTAGRRRGDAVRVFGGDIDPNATFISSQNLGKVGPAAVVRWDATRLPLAAASVDRIVCNPPFGKQMSNPEEIPALYSSFGRECNRVLRPGGRAVFIVMEQDVLRGVLHGQGWSPSRLLKVRLLGTPTILSVWQKPER